MIPGTRKLSIVCPVYNEEEVILDFHAELVRVVNELAARFETEIIYVVDRCTDRTLELLSGAAAADPRVKVLGLSARFGHQMSLLAGIDHARGDAVVMLDSDLEHPPGLIPAMIERWEQGFDIVFTTREASPKGFLKRHTSKLFYRVLNGMSNVPMTENSPDFRLISAKVARVFREQIRERNQFLRGLFSWVGFNRTSLGYADQMRTKGKTKYTVSRLLRFAISGIVSFSKRPLQWAVITGFAFALFGLFLALVTFIQFFTGQKLPQGWATLVVLISVVSGVQLIFLGIIGEYIGAIFDEVKARPHYIVDQAINFEEPMKLAPPTFAQPSIGSGFPPPSFPPR
ncbi:MAG: glycosyltransferase family 2 protein [Myxococcota bacterium]|nr:glycosyltransferase family 2 protein [Myxococcota bacterium]